MTIRSPLKWVGGKSASAERIIAAFPSSQNYDTYVEPCGGAGHVIICKAPIGREIYNDLDNNLVCFWREMQEHAAEMQARLDNLPYSRSIYYEYYRSLFDGTVLSSFERAVRWFYALRGTGTGWMRKSVVGWDYMGASKYRSALELFKAIQHRFSQVAIDNRDVLATIKRYDSPRTLFYVDHPYFGAEHYYEPSKNGFPHKELADLLQSVEGYVALSYYPFSESDAWYPATKWRRLTWQQYKSSQIQIPDRGDIATELLLTNYEPTTHTLWSEEQPA